MLSSLKALAARLRWRSFDGLPPTLPEDPYVGVREPRKRGPGGKSAAVALDEPEEPRTVQAYGPDRNRGISISAGLHEG